MDRIGRNLQHRTSWQVYARVLPVVFLAVLFVGAFGWVVFTRYATEQLVEHDREDVAFLLENLRQKTLVETMGLAARKADIEFEAGADSLSSLSPDAWASDLLRDPYLVCAALVERGSPGSAPAEGPSLGRLFLTDSLSGPVNETRLRAWFDANSNHFAHDLQKTGGESSPDPAVPVLADDNPWHPTFVFPPVLIEVVSGGSQASAGGDLAALLPVLVYEEEDGHEDTHTVYFLSLNRMMDDLLGDRSPLCTDDIWWCVVNYQGRVIDGNSPTPTIGSLLENQHPAQADGPFSVVSGADLVGDWRMGQPWRRSQYGSKFSPWVVNAGQSRRMPLALLVGHEARELGATNIGYIAAVFGVAMLSLLLALFGITRVVGRVSDRVMALTHSLKQIADGDYTQRVPESGHDEVGVLIKYFNRMADSLDEVQTALREKTAHLEASLENRRVLDRAKDDFLILISHEVRTPLTAIMGGVNILKSLVARTKGPEREILDQLNVIEVVDIIESSGERLHGFMNDAIQMTSIQSSDKDLELRPTPIGSLVELGLCGVRELAQVRHIEVVNGLENEDSWQVLCDEKVMKLAFARILKNAVEHNYNDGRVVIREVEEVPGEGRIGDLPQSEDVNRLISLPSFAPYADLTITWRLIEVFNTGEAIPAERRAALFGKFELVGRIEHHQRGSGLSLPIAVSAIESHGGRICVNSVRLQGNSFFLMLPTIVTEDLANRPSTEQPRKGLSGRAADHVVGQVADPARLKVELNDQSTSVSGGRDETGSGVDGPGRADYEKDVTLGGSRL